jgi:two-component system cell cycle sensor histidine kinase/response regulator CckA
MLEVSDNGTGVDERAVHHLFEPSAKGLPLDSSLSLATVSAIVRDAGGQMVLDTKPGGGTMLAACFPAVQPRRTRLPATGSACAVLVVDDDEWTRLSAARTLRRAGYGVLEAEHADAALELLDDVAGSCVSLILVDHRLASDGARPLGDRIHSERPDVHLLIATSPSATMTSTGNRSVLEKPFTPDDLVRAVQRRIPAPR